MDSWLTKEERMTLHSMKEDYLEIFHQKSHLRDDNPDLWQTIVTQWESIKLKLEGDEHDKIMSTATVHNE